MDILDNIIFTSFISAKGRAAVTSDYIQDSIVNYITNGGFANQNTAPFFYNNADKMFYLSMPDHDFIESAATKHWFDVTDGIIYNGTDSSGTAVNVSDFSTGVPYHLIFGYIIENTRILQIFEKIIQKYLIDEELGITLNNQDGNQAFQWLMNSEAIFFREVSARSVSNVRSFLRSSYEANRRNAYYRMFGMDLAFGDLSDPGSSTATFFKARHANTTFIVLLEQFLREVWQGYINARNTSGANSTDLQNIVNISAQLQDILNARRGGIGKPYQFQNLSKEEFYAVLIATWFTYVISFDSPIVQWLGCQGNTIGERLKMIGQKAGIPAHKRSQVLFEIAGPLATNLRAIEQGLYNNSPFVNKILTSLNPASPGTPQEQAAMNDLLTIINHWEDATGHRIKNPETMVNAAVRLQRPANVNANAARVSANGKMTPAGVN